MLTLSALGMFAYGAYSIGWAIHDLARGAQLEVWAELGLMAFGALLAFSALLVRLRVPGGVNVAVGALLGLQALAVHNAAHLEAGLAPQMGRATLAVVLVALAVVGRRPGGRAQGSGI
jgi:hypothetical protein